MALYAPTPPTPPTKPTAPQSLLKEGGTAHEITGKQPKSDEQKARDAVARGDGPLSKTTVTGGKEKTPAPKTNEGANKAAQNAKKREDIQTNNQPPAENDGLLTGDENQNRVTKAKKNFSAETGDKTNTSTLAPPADTAPQHGKAYWFFSILTMVVLAVAVIMTINKRARQKRAKPQTAAPPAGLLTPEKIAVLNAAKAAKNYKNAEKPPAWSKPPKEEKPFFDVNAEGGKNNENIDNKENKDKPRFEVRV